MELYLCSSDADSGLSPVLKQLKFSGIRCDFLAYSTFHNRKQMEQAIKSPQLNWLFVTNGMFMQHPDGQSLSLDEGREAFDGSIDEFRNFTKNRGLRTNWDIEVYNEPSLAPTCSVFKDPKVMAKLWDHCFHTVRSCGLSNRLLTPAPHNVEKKVGFRYLKAFLDHITKWDDNCRIAIHRYIPDPSHSAQKGWRNRPEEMDSLMSLIADRKFWVTETGITQGPWKKGWFKKKYWISEEQQGELIQKELDWWKMYRAEGACLYQINDGPDRNNRLHSYGIRRVDGSWKEYIRSMKNVG